MSSTGSMIGGAFLAALIGASSDPAHAQEIGNRQGGLALAQQVVRSVTRSEEDR
jgi:hypothetical protein